MTNGGCWLSILLPAYKVEAWLQDCAASILAQADEGVELVFCDDASPDGSAARVEALAAQHPGRVRLLRNERNLGISGTRNRLLDAARGDYLWFVDPDDLMEAGVLPRLKALIAAQQPDLVMCDFRAFDDGSNQQRPRYAHVPSFADTLPAGTPDTDRDHLLQGLFTHGQWHGWSKVIRRAIWPAALRFPEGRIFEDQALYPRLMLAVQRHVHVGEVWIAYRQRGGSALATLDAKRLDDWMEALVGYGALVQERSADTRFEIAHYCARTLLRAVRRAGKLGLMTPELAQRFRRQFEASSPLAPGELLRGYLRRGRLLRWLQLALWLRRASAR
ncbi:glycosyltransferase family 2 protein [Pelomonas sp. KK5]|uniref:glycosyltransferase family 2 protein n=1 Tax=Pelomonas sp. KK5 TaxID=1855730 RepID=UPI00097BADC4|nr:glycosyltransferase family 2 protein [Pelomonas sp. KK5]